MPIAVSFETQPRLAVFLTSFHPGGTERQMVELVRRLDPSRFAVHVACLHREGRWLQHAEAAALEVAEFPLSGFANRSGVQAVRKFARWCRERAIQVLQTCDFYSNVVGLAGAALAHVPVRIASRREIAPDKSRAQLALQRAAYLAAHRVVANSPAASNQLVAEGVDAACIRVIPNGIDLERFPALPRSGRIRQIVTVANLRPEKCHDVLLDAFARVVSAPGGPRELSLRIVGDGPLRRSLEGQARALGIDERVSFLGHRDDVTDLLASSDLFILPSRSEAFPNSAMEAMAAGLPVIASAVGGLLDLIEDGRNGLLVPACDVAALATTIERLMAQPTLAVALGASARRHVRERYSFDRMIAGFEHLYLTELHARVPLHAEHSALTVP
jgi:glycosyltransferase involved in cell wall biosynthesis